MGVNKELHDELVSQWSRIVAECDSRHIGDSIDAWCSRKGIHSRSYDLQTHLTSLLIRSFAGSFRSAIRNTLSIKIRWSLPLSQLSIAQSFSVVYVQARDGKCTVLTLTLEQK